MSAAKAINQVSSETGISVRIILSLVGLLITCGTVVGGIGVQASLMIGGLSHEIRALKTQIETQSREDRAAFQVQIDKINNEMERRKQVIYGAEDRWTDRDMFALQRANEAMLRGAGLDVNLPDPFAIKKGTR